ncbi:hypothetical protein [Phenylobacterium sp.]|uniref:hypothetical protein n=1 Tax=Phenylobacterium sp. TaxID=1871053 RepID=UPI0019B3C3BC|nr:hypothetical protein [Phenylobacterium sp.]MBC7168725.1 hypothetical protein [Phenylobacterium sp.]
MARRANNAGFHEYWSTVARRAFAEAVQASPWSSPARFGFAIAAAVAGSILTWVVSSSVPLTIFGSLVGVASALFLLFVVKLVTVPAAFHRETLARVPPQSVRGAHQPDTTIPEAFLFAITGSWGLDFASISTTSDEQQAVLKHFHQSAFDGKLRVWGRTSSAPDIEQIIPKTAWASNRLKPVSIISPDARTTMASSNPEAGYHQLRVCRSQ